MTEVLDLVIATIENNVELFDRISLNSLPEGNGLYCEISPGTNSQEYLNRSNNKKLPLLFMCKHTDQKICLNTLSSICNYIEKLNVYPADEGFKWINARVAETPNKTGRDERYYTYSCTVEIEINY